LETDTGFNQVLFGWIVGFIMIWLPGIISPVPRALKFPLSAVFYASSLTIFRIFNLNFTPFYLFIASSLLAIIFKFYLGSEIINQYNYLEDKARLVKPSKLYKTITLIFLSLFLIIALYKFIINPMGCCDNGFRWDYLAEMSIREKNINFYPPISSLDYRKYFYPDGIPLGLVSLLIPLRWLGIEGYYGRLMALPLIFSQFISGIFLMQSLATVYKAKTVYLWKAALIVMSTALAANFLIPSETSLMILGLGSSSLMMLDMKNRGITFKKLVVFGLLASLCSLVREYGLLLTASVYLSVLYGIFNWNSTKSNLLKVKLINAILVSTSSLIFPFFWYLMNYLNSGNPFLSIPFLGFSKHPVHAEYIQSVSEIKSLASMSFYEISKMNFWILWSCLPLLLLLIPKFKQKLFSSNKSLIIISFIPVVNFIRSLDYTSAGYGFSLRILMPGIFILSAIFISTFNIKPIKFIFLALISLKSLLDFAVGPGARYLIQSPIKTFSSIVDQKKYEKDYRNYFDLQEQKIKEIYEILDSHNIKDSLLVTDNAVLASQINKLGNNITTIWSPELSILFEEKTTLKQLTDFLKEKRIYFISNINWEFYGIEGERLKILNSAIKYNNFKKCPTCN